MAEFNKKLFKNISLHKSWEIDDVSESFVYFTNKQNTSIYEFMKMVLKNKISIIDNKFNYEFAIGTDSQIYTVNQYNSWVKQSEKNESNQIDYNELKVGYVYQYEDLNTFFIYLGKKYYVSWKFNKKTKKIELSKVQHKHLAYEVYKHNNFNDDSYYGKKCFNLKNKVVSEVQKYAGKLELTKILNHLKYSRNYVYLEDVKPENELTVVMKKINDSDLIQISESSNCNFVDMFLKSGEYFILKNVAVYKEAIDSNSDFYRQISKSDFDEVIFFQNAEFDLELYNETEKYYTYDCKLARLTENCSNDYFRIAPKDYYMITAN